MKERTPQTTKFLYMAKLYFANCGDGPHRKWQDCLTLGFISPPLVFRFNLRRRVVFNQRRITFHNKPNSLLVKNQATEKINAEIMQL
jgi:hypothetical protein